MIVASLLVKEVRNAACSCGQSFLAEAWSDASGNKRRIRIASDYEGKRVLLDVVGSTVLLECPRCGNVYVVG